MKNKRFQMKNEETGALGESLARDYLTGRGFNFRQANYRSPFGEIDIICQDKDCLVFVEVKARRGRGFGRPEEAVTRAKKTKLIAAAEHFLQHNAPEAINWRIDVVAIELGRDNQPRRIELIENAVTQD
jgi:putative endonuclease